MKIGSLPVLLAGLCFLLSGCGDDGSGTSAPPVTSQPSISGMSPSQFSIGQFNAEATIVGQNFAGVTAVQLGDGISVTGFESASASEVRVRFNIANNAASGARTISITASGGTATSSSVLQILNNHAPRALYTVEPKSGSTNSTFTFDASTSSDSDGNIASYSWDLGDGTEIRGKKITHKYARPGEFAVSLKVMDSKQGYSTMSRTLKVEKGVEIVCTRPAPNRGLIFGTVIGVEPDNNAIVKFEPGATCGNTNYYCGDMRKANPENFYGVIKKMTFLGDGTFRINNCFPYQWPPPIGERVFLIYKTCAQNPCPPK